MADRPSPGRARAVFYPLLSLPLLDLIRDPALREGVGQREWEETDAVIARVEGELEKLGVLEGLTPQQRNELAALVLDLDDRHARWRPARDVLAAIKRISKRGPGHVRKLVKKVARARDLLNEIVTDAQKVDRFFANHVVPSVTAAIEALDRVDLIRPRETSQQYIARLQSGLTQFESTHPQPEDPYRQAAGQLVRYLRSEPALPAAAAYVAAARIGRARWGWTCAIVKDDYGVEDCPAIRMLLGRAKAVRPTGRERRAAAQPSVQQPRPAHRTRKKSRP